MRAAPAIRLHCRDDAVWRVLHATLFGLAVAALLAWLLKQLEVEAAASAGAVLVACAAAGLGWRFGRIEPIDLAWDGTGWSLRPPSGDASACRVEVMLDFGDRMLLRATPLDRQTVRAARWLPVSRVAAGAAWHGLRAALHDDRVPSPSDLDRWKAGRPE